MIVDQNNRNHSYVATATTIYRIDCTSSSQLCAEPIYTLDASLPSIDDHQPDRCIVGIQHLSLNDELCVATSDGDVIIVRPTVGADESVAYCAGGIVCMSWSPDQEVVLFITGTGILVVMDTAYTPVAECDLSDSEFGDQAFVNVGWGKKETQFHGTEGKAARARPTADVVDDNDDGENVAAAVSVVAATWRGDSEFVAVSYAGVQGRMFKVFDKQGKLQFTSETTAAGLQLPIVWRPTGTWISIAQRLANKYVVALFEKNGLKHREILMPFKATEVSVGLGGNSK